MSTVNNIRTRIFNILSDSVLQIKSGTAYNFSQFPAALVTVRQASYNKDMNDLLQINREFSIIILGRSWLQGIELEVENELLEMLETIVSLFDERPQLQDINKDNPLPFVLDTTVVSDSGVIPVEFDETIYVGFELIYNIDYVQARNDLAI